MTEENGSGKFGLIVVWNCYAGFIKGHLKKQCPEWSWSVTDSGIIGRSDMDHVDDGYDWILRDSAKAVARRVKNLLDQSYPGQFGYVSSYYGKMASILYDKINGKIEDQIHQLVKALNALCPNPLEYGHPERRFEEKIHREIRLSDSKCMVDAELTIPEAVQELRMWAGLYRR